MKKIVVLLVLMSCCSLFAQTSTWTGGMSAITHGTGTETNPYLIESANQLAWMAYVVNNNISNYATAYYRLTININLNNSQWTPIGSVANFKGFFNGENHLISGLYINGSSITIGGLFGGLSGAVVQNVKVSGNISLTNEYSTAGGIVANAGSHATSTYSAIASEIKNCSFTGSVSAACAGGICGSLSGSYIYNLNYDGYDIISTSLITLCSNQGSISALAKAGGIVGSGELIHMSNCYNVGNISNITPSSSDNTYCGGLLGYVSTDVSNGYSIGHLNSDISNCYNNGIISSNSNVFAGAIIGYVGSSYGGSSYLYSDNCHYLYSSAPSAGLGTSQLSSLMQSASFVNTLNAGGSIWIQDVTPYQNSGYPIFGDLVRINQIMDVTESSAMLIGYIDEDLDYSTLGFKYKRSGESNYTITTVPDFLLCTLNNLHYSSTYQIQAFAHKTGYDTVFSKVYTFQTLSLPVEETVAHICQGETYTFYENPYTVTGIYDTVMNDTVQQLHLTVHQPYNHIINKTVCYGESYLFNDTVRFASGTYTAPLQSVYGCDSIVTLNLTVSDESRPEIMHLPDTAICRGDTAILTAVDGLTYHWSQNATTQNISVAPNYTTTYYVTVSNSTDCYVKDTIKVTVNSLPNIGVSGTLVFCEGNQTTLTATGAVSYSWNTGNTTASITVDTSGIYTVTGTGANGCSKSLSKTTIMRPLPNLTVNLEDTVICRGQSVALSASGGTRYSWSTGQTTASITAAPNATQNYRVTAYNSFNCFRSDTILITVNPIPLITYSGNTVLCEGESTTLTVSGSDNYAWSTGDTTAFLTVTPSTSTNFTVTSYNEDLCSAQLNIPVTVNQHTIAIDAQTACNSFTWIDGHTYTQSTDEPVYTIENAAGCDSVVTLHLTVNYANSGIDEQSECDSYTWIDGHTYTQSTGSPTYTLSNASGCDSVVTLHLVIYRSTYYTDVQTACDSYTWINGVTYTYSTQTPTTTLINNKGCDSVITLHLTIYSSPDVAIMGNLTLHNGESTTLTAFGGSSYLWSTGETSAAITVSPTTSTRYYVTGTTNYGCASEADVLVSVGGSVDVSEYEGAESVNIYPVPATSYLQVSGKNLSEALIYNTAGQLLMTEILRNEVNTLSVSHLAEGVYFMRIKTSGGEIITRKFIISTY